MKKKPNVLIIRSDQHNAKCLGANGHKQVKTPNLDKLASEGVNFTNAFVQSPICSPSRTSYLSGQYVHNHGVFGLTGKERLPEGLPSIFSVFKKSGYYTGIIGHIHVKEGWIRPFSDMYRDLFVPNNSYDRYLAEKGLLELRDDGSYKGHGQIVDGCPSELSFEDSNEGYCFQSFEEFLKRKPKDTPFLFQLDAIHPHENYIPAKNFWDMYNGVSLELPPSADEDLSSKPPRQQWTIKSQRESHNWICGPKTYEAGRLRKLQGYYGCISQVDYMVGLVRGKLREIGEEENTIIIYCSDHGDFALEHGFLEKAPGISYDAITRIPFIWYWPAGNFTTGKVEELVESVDLFPTLCSLVGIEKPDTIDGLDISKMLYGDYKPVRDFVITEFPLTRTIRTKEWKLCHYPKNMFPEVEDTGELYNVIEDPWEMKNLYGKIEYREIQENLRRTLFEWTQYTTRYGCIWPDTEIEMGKDGKTTPASLKKLMKSGLYNYL